MALEIKLGVCSRPVSEDPRCLGSDPSIAQLEQSSQVVLLLLDELIIRFDEGTWLSLLLLFQLYLNWIVLADHRCDHLVPLFDGVWLFQSYENRET